MSNQLCLQMDDSTQARALWESALRLAEPRIGREAVESWLRDAAPLSFRQGTLVLGVPNATVRTWVEKKYAGALMRALSEARGCEAGLEVVVAAPPATPAPAKKRETGAAASLRRPPASGLFAPIPLNERYTFENFVVGSSNRFAHAAAAAVAARPGREYNPLFLYGGVGLGKTHLLQAIGRALLERDRALRVAYVSAETFTAHFIASLRERRQEEFRRAYRGVHVWLVDDLQFIADKASTREEFFHTFNELYLTNRQIVLASDRPPCDLHLMENRLRTRLESGLMAEIGPPDLETRLAILQRRAALEGAAVPPEVLHLLARAIPDNVRTLEAALIRTLALASLDHAPVTPEVAARALAAFARESRPAEIDLLAIQRAVCEQFRLPEEQLVGPRRDRATALARQVAIYLMRELTRKSLAEIGRAFGGKSHSTVLYSCAKLQEAMRSDPALEATVRALRERLAKAA